MLIAQLTDLHVRPPGVAAYRVVETNMLTERALRSAMQHRPDLLLLTGDLTDCGLRSEYALLADMLRRLVDVPVLAIPGNHDRREVMAECLPGTALTDGFVQFVDDRFPVRIVMLDTVVPGSGHGELCPARLRWLDQTLSADPSRPTLIGMHHPPFNTGIQHMDRIALRDRAAFGGLLARHEQVQLVICGHHHRPIVTRIGHAIVSIAPSVAHQVEFDLRDDAPAALVLEPPAFELHRWSAEDGFVSHVALVERYPGPFPFTLDPDYPGAQPGR